MQLRFASPRPETVRGQIERLSRSRFGSTYRLCFGEDGLGPEHTIEFDAYSPGAALALLERDRRGRTVALWEGNRCLCMVRRSCGPHPVWIVAPCPETSGPLPGRRQPV